MDSKPEIFIERRLSRQTERALKDAGIKANTSLLIGVSGGPDSMALLHILSKLRKPLSLNLTVAHVNHGIRPIEGIEDLRFVREQATRLHIPVFTRTLEYPHGRPREKSVSEQFLRTARYQFFEDIAKELSIDHVVVAHTADDQAETVLLHLLRGTGISGLSGMPLIGQLPLPQSKVHLLRPLLEIDKRSTLQYCDAVGITPRIDSSNQSSIFLRNRIRNELIPILSEYNPAISEALRRLSRTAYETSDFMAKHVQDIWNTVVEESASHLIIYKKNFVDQHPAIQSAVIRKAYGIIAPPDSMISQKQLEDVRQLLSGSAGRQLRLPGQIEFTTTYTSGEFRPSSQENLKIDITGTYPLSIPGVSNIPNWKVESSVVSRYDWENLDTDLPVNNFLAFLDMDAIGDAFYVRNRLQGDRFQPLGMPQEKRLQDFFVDQHVPQRQRDQIPLLISSKGIVWVVGHRIADWARITEATANVLVTQFRQVD